MASRVMVIPARAYDHLYDPVFTVGHSRDHGKAQSMSGYIRVERVPNAPYMFSEVALYPRHVFRLKSADLVPAWVQRNWRGPDASPQVDDLSVTGSNRHKYFRRPIIPFLHAVPPEVILAAPEAPAEEVRHEQNVAQAQEIVVEDISGMRTVGTQSDFRESEAQTDPYTPDYVVRPGSAPELLTLAALSWGNGLPAGVAEVEMIERARAKRAFEASLPPITDEASLDLRRKMMQEQELKEWAEREQEIQQLQEKRLRVIEDILRAKDQEAEERDSGRVVAQAKTWDAETERVVASIQQRRIKALRKLAKARKLVEGGLEKRNIVKDYADYSSQVYAPFTRRGVFPDKNADRYEVKPPLLQSYQGLLQLERSLPKSLLTTTVKKPAVSKPRSVKERKDRQLAADLERIAASIKDSNLKGSETTKKLEIPAAYRAEPPPVRPVTPTVEPPDHDEDKEVALIFLQRLLRGRAIQNVMYEGKEKRLELIKELRTMEQLTVIEQEIENEEGKERVRGYKEKMINSQLDALQGDVLGTTLDFFAKELVRFKEERRIAAIVALAERTRRKREAEESGRRQEEELRRLREDEQFRQIMRVHQGSVDSYLQEIVMGVVDQAASEQAHHEAQVKAQKINSIVDLLEERYNAPETIVRDLVSSFLLPEVERSSLRTRVELDQRKFVNAAHKELYTSMDDMQTQGQQRPIP